MKIVLPVHHFPPRYSAGAELYTLRLAHWLQNHGHTVEVICVEAIDQGDPGELQAVADCYEGLTVWRLSFNMAHAADASWRYHNPLMLDWFTKHFAREQPDLVHAQAGYLLGAVPIIAARTANIPMVLTLHDYWFLCPRITLQRGDGSLCTHVPTDPAGCAWCINLESRRYRLPDQLTKGLLGRAAQQIALHQGRQQITERRGWLLPQLAEPDAVIAPSKFLAERYAPFVPAERMHVVRYGINASALRQEAQPRTDNSLRIGFLGQIAPHKGVHLLIDAFRMLQSHGPALELHIHGGLEPNPAYVTKLRSQAAGDTRICFHGRFSHHQTAAILAELDVVVVPSVWYENSPLAIMEAHAAGKPVVTAALGGMAELVRNGVDGLHFTPNDSADLACQLQRLIDQPALLSRLRNGIREPASIDDEMRQITGIYEQITEHSAAVNLQELHYHL